MGRRLDKKARVNFKIYDATNQETNNYNTHIARRNQTMKLGQLIEYNMENIFLEKSYAKCGGEITPKPFSQKSKLSISLDQQSKV